MYIGIEYLDRLLQLTMYPLLLYIVFYILAYLDQYCWRSNTTCVTIYV